MVGRDRQRNTRRKGKRAQPSRTTSAAPIRPSSLAERILPTRGARPTASPRPPRSPLPKMTSYPVTEVDVGKYLSPEQQYLLKVRRAAEQREAGQRRSVVGLGMAVVALVAAAVTWLLGWRLF